MFGKIILPTRSAAALPQFQSEGNSQRVSKKPRFFVKKLIHINHLFHRSPSAQKDADCKGTSHCQQAVPATSQPAQGSPALAEAEFARRPNPHSSIQTPRSPASVQLSPSAQLLLQEPPTFTFDGSKPSSLHSPTDQVIAQLHATAAYLDRQLVGGEGGFGSQLRAAGRRMSSQKTSNNDSCRDLNGRRLSTVKEAKKIAQYLEDEPLGKQAELEAKKAKLEALEKQLGISTQATNAEAEPSSAGAGPSNAEAGPSNAGDKGKRKEPEKLAGKKDRFEDTEYLEQSEAIVDNVKSAVAAALLKKRQKARTSANAHATTPATLPKTAMEEDLAEAKKESEPAAKPLEETTPVSAAA
ncbi:hypothetical protein FRC01_000870 [Tulasnella sp. 417]|nr:hypothetical protein FRC01_000870 [Tulasnella sp. 417]